MSSREMSEIAPRVSLFQLEAFYQSQDGIYLPYPSVHGYSRRPEACLVRGDYSTTQLMRELRDCRVAWIRPEYLVYRPRVVPILTERRGDSLRVHAEGVVHDKR